MNFTVQQLNNANCRTVFIAVITGIQTSYIYIRGKRQRSWLRHYATRRMVAGSIPD
jgi:hypothetical protein